MSAPDAIRHGTNPSVIALLVMNLAERPLAVIGAGDDANQSEPNGGCPLREAQGE